MAGIAEPVRLSLSVSDAPGTVDDPTDGVRGMSIIEDYADAAQGVRLVDPQGRLSTLLRNRTHSEAPNADGDDSRCGGVGAGYGTDGSTEAMGVLSRSGSASSSAAKGSARLTLRAGHLIVGAPLRQGKPSAHDVALGLVCAVSGSAYHLRFMWRHPANSPGSGGT
jgi:hypothetical protein